MGIDRQDLLYTIRSARRAPLLSAIAVLALSLAIGLNAGVFTLLNTLFLSSPSRSDPATFIQLYPRYEGWFTGAGQFSAFTTEDFAAIRAHAATLSEVAASLPSGYILDELHRNTSTALVSCNFFHVFGIDRPLLGRLLADSECRQNSSSSVAVLTEALWRTNFDADPQLIGRTIHLNTLPFTVVGIVSSESANNLQGQVFLPFTLEPVLDRNSAVLTTNPDIPWLTVVARLRPGSSRSDAAAELTGILRQQDRAYLQRKLSTFNRKTSVVVTNGSYIANPAFSNLSLVLMLLILGPLTLVLLLACCNVTMLFLSRAILRRGEIAIRLALGVTRPRLLRMLALESFVTAAIAGLIGLALSYRIPGWVLNAINPERSGLFSVDHPDWRVFSYLTCLVALATIASSFAPMHAAWKLDIVTALKGREAAATMRSRMTSALIVAQIAMSFVLLSAAVLFVRLPSKVSAMDPGFETHSVLSVPLAVNSASPNHLETLHAIESRLRAIPGVQSIAWQSRSLSPIASRRSPPPGTSERPGKPRHPRRCFGPVLLHLPRSHRGRTPLLLG